MPNITLIDECDEVTAYQRGRVAFWNGKAIWANPHIHLQAAEWRKGWMTGNATFHELAGRGSPTAQTLKRFRPPDLPSLKPYKCVTSKVGGQRARLAMEKTLKAMRQGAA